MADTQSQNGNWQIRDWRESDAADIAKTINNPAILANLRDGIPLPYTEADGLEFIRVCLGAPKGSQYSFCLEVDGKAAGSIGFFRGVNIHSRTAELGYYLAEEHWGKGIMSHAVKAACDKLFEETDILRIFAEPFATNAASCRVLEKAGFAHEGTLRKNAVKNGTVLDMELYARVV